VFALLSTGRMGDTFPHTFTCQDQRLRVGGKYSTLVQELGRLCRYPSVQCQELLSRQAAGDQHSPQLHLLEQALHQAYGTEQWQVNQRSAWMNTVNTIAAAASQQLKELVRMLHQCLAQSKAKPPPDRAKLFQQLQAAAKAVSDMPGAGLAVQNTGSTLTGIVDSLNTDLRYTAGAKPQDVLTNGIRNLTAWRQQVLTTLDGSGYLLSDRRAPVFKGGLPVRIMVNGRFEADCLDSNDLVERPVAVQTVAFCRMTLPSA